MKIIALGLLAACTFLSRAFAAVSPDEVMPIRGFCIEAPRPESVDKFVSFVDNELAPRGINTLVLRVDYKYQWESHPELREDHALSKADVKKLVAVCRKDGIKLIPHINFLGHQSFHRDIGKLLEVYPEFDETPALKLPEAYTEKKPGWMFCKSYCPLHPKVHDVTFAVMDELCDVFEADTFHAGMDEVHFLGDDKCPRCHGHDKAELFADEVRRIDDHLKEHGRHMWIWGDRLLSGPNTGLGEWEASYVDTSRAIDLIPKDVVIADWHYDNPAPTPPYFAIKGLDVVTVPWKNGPCAIQQTDDMARWRVESMAPMKEHFRGMLQSVWTSFDGFMAKDYAGKGNPTNTWSCFVGMTDEIKKLGNNPPQRIKP